VKFHILQHDFSHLHKDRQNAKFHIMKTPTTPDIDALFRENLFRLMGENGLTAAELSKKANLNARAVKDIEEGRSKSPKLSTAKALADALGVSLDYLVMPAASEELAAEANELIEKVDEATVAKVLAAIKILKL